MNSIQTNTSLTTMNTDYSSVMGAISTSNVPALQIMFAKHLRNKRVLFIIKSKMALFLCHTLLLAYRSCNMIREQANINNMVEALFSQAAKAWLLTQPHQICGICRSCVNASFSSYEDYIALLKWLHAPEVDTSKIFNTIEACE